MVSAIRIPYERTSTWRVCHQSVGVSTLERFQFRDVTELVSDIVRGSGIRHGLVNVQSQHTTTAIIVNENEPLLLEDMKRVLEQLAPVHGTYQHDNFRIRTVNLMPDEGRNGHAHIKAMLLRTSETLNVIDGTLALGRWQRIFLVELDRSKEREMTVVVMGEAGGSGSDVREVGRKGTPWS